MKKSIAIMFFLFFSVNIFSETNGQKESKKPSKKYIDVVIPLHEKDVEKLDCVIDAVEKNIKRLRNIYIVSKESYSDRAIWVDESIYPFSIEDVGREIGGKGGVGNHNRRGWYFQQLLKFYVFEKIEGISDYVLILDGDTKPAKEMDFIYQGKILCDCLNGPCIFGTYYRHMSTLLPSLQLVNRSVNPVIHHALFKREIVTDLIQKVEEIHQKPFWKVFLNAVDMRYGTTRKGFYVGASEYMIYYHFCMRYHRDKVIPRVIRLRERGIQLDKEYDLQMDFVSSHKYIL